MLLLLALVVVGVAVAFYFRVRNQPDRYFSANEFWVYIPTAKMPPQDEIMTRVLRDNPAGQVIGPKEGLLMSDIRLHIALVLKSKNAYLFRPDLFEEHIEPTVDILRHLALSEALVKVRYISEEPLKDRANLQLLPHLAAAVADMAGGKVIYDTVAEKLLTTADFSALLRQNKKLDSAQLQARIIWKQDEEGCWAESRGLKKIGFPELQTKRMDADQKVLITQVLETALEELWKLKTLPEEVMTTLYGDCFVVKVSRNAKTELLRVQERG